MIKVKVSPRLIMSGIEDQEIVLVWDHELDTFLTIFHINFKILKIGTWNFYTIKLGSSAIRRACLFTSKYVNFLIWGTILYDNLPHYNTMSLDSYLYSFILTKLLTWMLFFYFWIQHNIPAEYNDIWSTFYLMTQILHAHYYACFNFPPQV